MDSSIREALRNIIEAAYSTYEKNGKTRSLEDGNGELLFMVPFDAIHEGKQALLTAEPEPCEDMDAAFQRAFCVSHLDLMSKDQKVAYETFKAGWRAASHRLQEMQEEVERMRSLIGEAWDLLTDKDIVSYDPWEGWADSVIARLHDVAHPDKGDTP